MTGLNEPVRLTEKIPRPRNAFILFRQHHHKLLIDEWTVQGVEIPHNSKISKILGIKWKALAGDEKVYWEEMARKEKSDHEKKYPDYRYKPIRKHKKKQQQLQQQLYLQHALYNSNNNVINGGPNFLRQIVIPNGNTSNNYVCSPRSDSAAAPLNSTNGLTNTVKTREENNWKPFSVSTIPRHSTTNYDNTTPLPSFQPQQQELSANIPNGNNSGQYNTVPLPVQQGSNGNVQTFEQAQSQYQYIDQNQNQNQNQNPQTKPNQHMYPYFVQPLQQNYLSKPIPPNRSSTVPQPGSMMPAGMNQNVLPNQSMISNQNMIPGAPVMYPTPLQMQLQMQMQMEMQMQLQLQMQMQMQMNKNKDGSMSNANAIHTDPFNEFAYHSHQYPQPFIKKPGSDIALQPIDDQQRHVSVEEGNNEKSVHDMVNENDINSDYRSSGHK